MVTGNGDAAVGDVELLAMVATDQPTTRLTKQTASDGRWQTALPMPPKHQPTAQGAKHGCPATCPQRRLPRTASLSSARDDRFDLLLRSVAASLEVTMTSCDYAGARPTAAHGVQRIRFITTQQAIDSSHHMVQKTMVHGEQFERRRYNVPFAMPSISRSAAFSLLSWCTWACTPERSRLKIYAQQVSACFRPLKKSGLLACLQLGDFAVTGVRRRTHHAHHLLELLT